MFSSFILLGFKAPILAQFLEPVARFFDDSLLGFQVEFNQAVSILVGI